MTFSEYILSDCGKGLKNDNSEIVYSLSGAAPFQNAVFILEFD